MTINLIYRIKRLFRGESGIVEKVELDKNSYQDDVGNWAKSILIRNPLGELIERDNPWVTELRRHFNGRSEYYKIYKQYEVGDIFP